MSSNLCIKDNDRCQWNGALGYCCSGNCFQNEGEEYGQCAKTTSTSTEPSTSTTTSTVKTEECLQDADRCQWTGALGYCCSGNCIQNEGEEYGHCATTISTSMSPSTAKTCLSAGSRCQPDGSLGTCCSVNCNRLAEQLFGVCVGSEPPTNLPEKCLKAGADCTASGSLGFCCLGFCHVLSPHTVGICMSPKQEPNVVRQVENDHSWIIYASVTASLLILLMLGFVWLYRRQKKLEKGLSQKEIDQFLNGDPESLHINGYAHEHVDNLPYKKELEIPESDFSVDFESKLGSGCFGLVLKGKVRDIEVAAKTIRSSLSDGSHLRSLLSEIKTLQYIGSFENIVSMIGSNTSNLDEGKVFLFLEYCPLGSLEKCLRDNKYNFTKFQNKDRQYENYSAMGDDNSRTLDLNMLLQWSLQITNAMKFLAVKKVIHADLATRNVLLYKMDCVKLTDFGLSRKLYDYGNYVKRQQEPLPWRWMSLESLTQLSFSHQSDVWSLGVTFWEIFSLGDVPYPGLTWNNEFVYCLQNDMRPTKPSIASHELYDIMLDCWKPMPDTRPKFEEIYRRLDEYQKNYVKSTSSH